MRNATRLYDMISLPTYLVSEATRYMLILDSAKEEVGIPVGLPIAGHPLAAEGEAAFSRRQEEAQASPRNIREEKWKGRGTLDRG